MENVAIICNSENSDRVQLKLFEGGCNWGNKDGKIELIPYKFHYIAVINKNMSYGNISYLQVNSRNRINAEDFLKNPQLVHGWDDRKLYNKEYDCEPITPILKGSTMLYEVAIVEKADKDGKNERIVQTVMEVVADSQKAAEFQALQAMIKNGLEADPNRLEVIARPFKA
jgi:hypothetical protein